MKRKMVRVFKVCFLFLAILGLVAMIATVQVAAQDASGKWTSRIAGEGMVIGTHPGSCYYDVQLTLSQTGVNRGGIISYTGTFQSICVQVVETTGYEGQLQGKIGESANVSASGKLDGANFALTIYDPEGPFTYPLTLSDGRIFGSGEYSDPQTQISYDYSFDLKSDSSGGNGEPPDTDGDGLPDSWEIEHFGNLTQNGSGDFDGDGLTNLQEYEFGTDPDNNQADGDGDGLPDLWEIVYFGDLSKRGSRDTDSDGHSNLQEYEAGSDPNDPLDEPEDTDEDGMSDTWEMENFNSLDPDADNDYDGDDFTNIQEYLGGTDPSDITDYPYTSSETEDSDNTTLLALLATLAMVAIFGILIFANARRYKKKYGGPRQWTPPPQQDQQPPQEQPPTQEQPPSAEEPPPTQEPPQYQEQPPPPPGA